MATGCYWKTPASQFPKKRNSTIVKQWFRLHDRSVACARDARWRTAASFADGRIHLDSFLLISLERCGTCSVIHRYDEHRLLLEGLPCHVRDRCVYKRDLSITEFRLQKSKEYVSLRTNVDRVEQLCFAFMFRFDGVAIDENVPRGGTVAVRCRTLIFPWVDLPIEIRNDHHCGLIVPRLIIADFRARNLIVEEPLMIVVRSV